MNKKRILTVFIVLMVILSLVYVALVLVGSFGGSFTKYEKLQSPSTTGAANSNVQNILISLSAKDEGSDHRSICDNKHSLI